MDDMTNVEARIKALADRYATELQRQIAQRRLFCFQSRYPIASSVKVAILPANDQRRSV